MSGHHITPDISRLILLQVRVQTEYVFFLIVIRFLSDIVVSQTSLFSTSRISSIFCFNLHIASPIPSCLVMSSSGSVITLHTCFFTVLPVAESVSTISINRLGVSHLFHVTFKVCLKITSFIALIKFSMITPPIE